MNYADRFRIFKRDGFKCRYCGKSSTEGATLQVDHVHPVSKGGDNRPSNLVTACWECNIGKGSKPMSENEVPLTMEQKAQKNLDEKRSALVDAAESSLSGICKATEASQIISARVTNLLDWHDIPNVDFSLSQGDEYETHHKLKVAKRTIRLLHSLNEMTHKHYRNVLMSLYEAKVIGQRGANE